MAHDARAPSARSPRLSRENISLHDLATRRAARRRARTRGRRAACRSIARAASHRGIIARYAPRTLRNAARSLKATLRCRAGNAVRARAARAPRITASLRARIVASRISSYHRRGGMASTDIARKLSARHRLAAAASRAAAAVRLAQLPSPNLAASPRINLASIIRCNMGQNRMARASAARQGTRCACSAHCWRGRQHQRARIAGIENVKIARGIQNISGTRRRHKALARVPRTNAHILRAQNAAFSRCARRRAFAPRCNRARAARASASGRHRTSASWRGATSSLRT